MSDKPKKTVIRRDRRKHVFDHESGKWKNKKYHNKENIKLTPDKGDRLRFLRTPKTVKAEKMRVAMKAEEALANAKTDREKALIFFERDQDIHALNKFGLRDASQAFFKIHKFGRMNKIVNYEKDGKIVKTRVTYYNGMAIKDGMLFKVDRNNTIRDEKKTLYKDRPITEEDVFG